MLGGWPVGPVRLPGLPRLADADRAALARILSALGQRVVAADAAE
jgi:4-hydroxy-tetrahydrodipicolinate synthase